MRYCEIKASSIATYIRFARVSSKINLGGLENGFEIVPKEIVIGNGA